MPKRNRAKEQRKSGGPVVASEAPVSEAERAAKLFAESVRAHEAADRAKRQRQEEAEAHKLRHVELQAARRDAADRLKQLRGSGARREQIAAAEADYRTALAELQEFETGERPHWAPAAATTDAGNTDDPGDVADEVGSDGADVAEDQPS